MAESENDPVKLGVQKYCGKNAADVIEELQKQGYTTIQYGTNRLIQGRPLSPIPDSKTAHIYIDRSTDTVQQIMIMMKK